VKPCQAPRVYEIAHLERSAAAPGRRLLVTAQRTSPTPDPWSRVSRPPDARRRALSWPPGSGDDRLERVAAIRLQRG
jgi:hypothetical protein